MRSVFLNGFAALIFFFSALSFCVAEGVHSTQSAGLAGTPDSHAPIMVMGDHTHAAGEWMFSYRFMQMQMQDNLLGSDAISPAQITSLSSSPGLRVVPLEMTTDMHMLGLMYAPSEDVTLMLMANYIDKNMEHITFAGMSGATELGRFTTQASGIGDTKLSALIKLKQRGSHKTHFNIGLSIPTGSIDEKDTILTPMGMTPTVTLPYAMQMGSGTWDFESGITYTGASDKRGWGAQYKAVLRIDDNDQDYSLGDEHKLTTWASYRLQPWLSGSLRLSYTKLNDIDGADKRIALPVQTANPKNYGGERVDLALGFNFLGQRAAVRGHRLALEYEQPIAQHVNGVQLEMHDMFTLGYQYAF